MIRIDDLIARVSQYIPDPAAVDAISRAYVYSATLHRNTFSPTGMPTLQHALEVGGILAELKLDARCIVAGLLHDVLEHSLADPAALRQAVGEDAAQLVEEVSRLARASFQGTEAMRAQHMREMILASTRDLRVILLLLADRLQTLRAPDQLAPETRSALARETLAIYAPIADRLGVHFFKSDLEDRAFELLEPDRYAEMQREVSDRLKARQPALAAINGELERLLTESGMRCQVLGRIKHLYSVYAKMVKKHVGLERVQDLLATRIIVPNNDDCYKALGMIHAHFTPLPGRFKDYIALPKANGYQSLHTHVIAPSGDILEIQIRTEAMHREAELGIAAHFIYKDGAPRDDKELASVTWFRQLLENLEDGKDPHESMDLLARDLTPDEIFLFTPAGEVIKLPAGATPIDFAYAVHSQVGEHCTGAKLDGRMVSIRTPLRNGSVVEILTAQRQSPNEDWLKFAVSSRAQSKIRAYLRNQEKAESLRVGKDAVTREAKRAGKRVEDLLKLEPFQDWMRRNNLHSPDELYVAEAQGQANIKAVLERLFPPAEGATPAAPAAAQAAAGQAAQARSGQPRPGAPTAATRGGLRVPVRIAGMENLMVRFAKCCAPVPGDPLAGLITRGRGVSVHHRDCAILARTMDFDQRRVEVEWSEEVGKRPVNLVIRATTSLKHLVEVVSLLEEEGTAITSGRITSKQGVYTQHLSLLVGDSRQLKRILQRLNAMEGIRAERVLESA